MIKYMNLVGVKARKASQYKVETKVKNKVLNDYAKLIKNEKKLIISQNLKDINYARKKGLKENLIKRLHLNEDKLDGIINSILKIAKLRDPIDSTLEKWKRPNGLNIKRVSIPIGVIGVIYESRPNVTSDVASLCFKSGKSLLAAGIKKVSGKFNKGDHIKILDKKNNECARGLSSFTSDEVIKIMGHHSNEIEKLLGYIAKSEVIHKDDMVEI